MKQNNQEFKVQSDIRCFFRANERYSTYQIIEQNNEKNEELEIEYENITGPCIKVGNHMGNAFALERLSDSLLNNLEQKFLTRETQINHQRISIDPKLIQAKLDIQLRASLVNQPEFTDEVFAQLENLNVKFSKRFIEDCIDIWKNNEDLIKPSTIIHKYYNRRQPHHHFVMGSGFRIERKCKRLFGYKWKQLLKKIGSLERLQNISSMLKEGLISIKLASQTYKISLHICKKIKNSNFEDWESQDSYQQARRVKLEP